MANTGWTSSIYPSKLEETNITALRNKVNELENRLNNRKLNGPVVHEVTVKYGVNPTTINVPAFSIMRLFITAVSGGSPYPNSWSTDGIHTGTVDNNLFSSVLRTNTKTSNSIGGINIEIGSNSYTYSKTTRGGREGWDDSRTSIVTDKIYQVGLVYEDRTIAVESYSLIFSNKRTRNHQNYLVKYKLEYWTL